MQVNSAWSDESPDVPDGLMKPDNMLQTAPTLGRDAWTFVRSFFEAPLRTGAQVPSGRALARAVASAVDIDVPGTIIELGSGTGPVTQALLEHGVKPERLLLVEANQAFCNLLRHRYPECRLIQGDALALPRRLEQEGGGADPVAAVVSCLPLMVLAPEVRLRLLHDCLRLMGPHGRFIQFTYAFGSPVPVSLSDVALRVRASRRIWRNVWPAKVWTYQRADLESSTRRRESRRPDPE